MQSPPLHASNEQAQLPGRRIWLKPAAATLASAYALPSLVTASSSQPTGRPEKAIESNMVGFMLAHEQFTVRSVCFNKDRVVRGSGTQRTMGSMGMAIYPSMHR